MFVITFVIYIYLKRIMEGFQTQHNIAISTIPIKHFTFTYIIRAKYPYSYNHEMSRLWQQRQYAHFKEDIQITLIYCMNFLN